MDVYSDLPHCYNGISDVSFYTKDPNESSPTNVNNQGGLGYESYRGPGMSLAVSPTLFSVPSAFAQDQPNQFASGDLDITDPYKSALRRADQPNHDSFVKVDQEFSSTTGVILRTGPIGKQCRRRYCPQKWAAIQSIVQRLYMDQGRSLHETMRILEEEHSFKASYVYVFFYLPWLKKEGSHQFQRETNQE